MSRTGKAVCGSVLAIAVLAGLVFMLPAEEREAAGASAPTAGETAAAEAPNQERGATRAGAAASDEPTAAAGEAEEAIDPRVLGIRVCSAEADVPIAGATVSIFPVTVDHELDLLEYSYGRLTRAGDGFPDRPATTARTDIEGRVSIRTPEADILHVHVSAPGHAPHATYLYSGQEERVLTLSAELEARLRVVDVLGAPVGGATVRVTGPEGHHEPGSPPVEVLRTGPDGRVGLRLGVNHEARILADGYAPLQWTPSGRDPAERTVILEAGRTLSGRVTDAAGEAIPGALVRLSESDIEPLRVTDAAGRFSFERMLSMAESSYGRLSVHAGGYADREARYFGVEEPVEVRLLRAVDLVGVVVDATGRMPPGLDLDLEWSGRPGVDVSPDESGRFVVPDVGAEPGTLTAFGQAGEPELELTHWRARLELDPREEPGEIRVVLEELPHSFLTVRIVDPDGEPIEGADFSVEGGLPPDGPSYRGPPVSTDADGRLQRYVLAPPGTPCVLRLDLPDDLAAEGEIVVPTVARWDAAPTEVRTRRTTRVVLEFAHHDGTPIDGAAWAARLDGDRLPGGLQLVEGKLQREVYLKRQNTIVGQVRGLGPYSVELDPDAAPEGPVLVRLERCGSIRGRVTLEHGGVPEGSVDLTVSPTHRMLPEDGAFERIGADGRFVFEAIPAGTFVVLVTTPQNTVLALRTGTIEPGESVDLGDVSADVSTWVTVVVKDAAGRPAAGADVEYSYAPTWESLAWESTDAQGRLRGPRALGRGQVLRADTESRGVALVYSAPTDPVSEVRLARPAELLVRVKGAPREPWVWVDVRPDGLDTWIYHDFYEPSVDDDGVIRITRLAPCQVRVQTGFADERGAQWQASTELRVRAGERKTIVLEPERVVDDE